MPGQLADLHAVHLLRGIGARLLRRPRVGDLLQARVLVQGRRPRLQELSGLPALRSRLDRVREVRLLRAGKDVRRIKLSLLRRG